MKVDLKPGEVVVEFGVLQDICFDAGNAYMDPCTMRVKCRRQSVSHFCVTDTCPLLRGEEGEDENDNG